MDEATSEPLPPPPEKPLNGDEQQLASLRSRYYALAAKVAEGKLTLEDALAEADKRDSRPKSGFARLKNRTAKVYAELNDCKAALARKDQDIDTLGGEVEKLVADCKKWSDSSRSRKAESHQHYDNGR